MEDQLWNLFRETGEPMGYLLYRAEKQKQTEQKKKAHREGIVARQKPPKP